MSDDLIRRSDAIKAIEELPNAYNGWSDAYDKAYIIGTLEEVPKADRPQGDSVSRRYLLAEIDDLADEFSEVDENGLHSERWCGILDSKGIIVNAPSVSDRPQGEWIPCSERLPSKSGEYLVTIIQNESSFQQGVLNVFIRFLAPANILYGEGFGEQMVWRQELWEDVVAWMPLPEPWKGADDE